MTLPKLLAFGVFGASLAALVVVWSLFFTMWLHAETSLTVYANQFGEFWTEFVLYLLATICLPVLVYEIDAYIRD